MFKKSALPRFECFLHELRCRFLSHIKQYGSRIGIATGAKIISNIGIRIFQTPSNDKDAEKKIILASEWGLGKNKFRVMNGDK